MLQSLKDKKVLVGTKQVKRAIKSGQVELVFIADDSEEKVVSELLKLCVKFDIRVEHIAKMKELGATFGIDVKAASAALLK